ncbi:X-linked retinitis pigmentosa GTPase regulator-interacting protein 1 [Monodelphis domestica]|uniref:X-linked retinitis pigmentosa GTPase regulator-interacting protein 1 n=1 Tax=Monodelphis domestica TaxID=13616 RepID=UPI0024E266B9|nr:X-linked retinitis pigmentosa GTPase regulator-interacting protein 1 [Monodelphis domestica]
MPTELVCTSSRVQIMTNNTVKVDQQELSPRSPEKTWSKDEDSEEKSSLEHAQLATQYKASIRENVELIQVMRLLHERSAALAAAKAQEADLQENQKILSAAYNDMLSQLEEFNKELKEKSKAVVNLEKQLSDMSVLRITVREFQERMEDLKRERSLLKNNHDRLLKNMLNSSNQPHWSTDLMKERLQQKVSHLQEQLDSEVAEKRKILLQLAKEQAENADLKQEVNQMLMKHKKEVEILQQKTNTHSISSQSESEFLQTSQEDYTKETQTHELSPPPVKKEEEKTLSWAYNQMKVAHAETALELEKTKDMLFLQHQINKRYQNELEIVKIKADNSEREHKEEWEKLNQLLDLKNNRIQQLEGSLGRQRLTAGFAQLRDVAYGTLRFPLRPEMMPIRGENDVVDSLQLRQGENLFELHIHQASLSPAALSYAGDAQLASFCTYSFYDFEIHCTPLAEGPQPLYDFTSQYVVRTDSLFLSYLQGALFRIVLHQAVAIDHSILAVGCLRFDQVLETEEKVRGTAVLSGTNGEDFGTLDYWMRLRVPIAHCLWASSKRLKAQAYLSANVLGARKVQPEESRSEIFKLRNVLWVEIVRCCSLRSRRVGTQPSPYAIYQFFTFSDHDTPIIPASNHPHFGDRASFPVHMTLELDQYLRQTVLSIYVFDDNESELGWFLGKAQVPLQPLAQDKAIQGNFILSDPVGKPNGSIELKLDWESHYLSQESSLKPATQTVENYNKAPLSVDNYKEAPLFVENYITANRNIKDYSEAPSSMENNNAKLPKERGNEAPLFVECYDEAPLLEENYEALLPTKNHNEANLSIENNDEEKLSVENYKEANLSVEDYNETNLITESYNEANLSIEDYEENLPFENYNKANKSIENCDAANLSIESCDKVEKLYETNLFVENFEETNLSVENFGETNLYVENFEETNLSVEQCHKANLSIENCEKTNLSIENFEETNLSLENCEEPNLSIETNLSIEKCEEVEKCYKANLSVENCEETNLSIVNFEEVEKCYEANLSVENCEKTNLSIEKCEEVEKCYEANLSVENCAEVENSEQANLTIEKCEEVEKCNEANLSVENCTEVENSKQANLPIEKCEEAENSEEKNLAIENCEEEAENSEEAKLYVENCEEVENSVETSLALENSEETNLAVENREEAELVVKNSEEEEEAELAVENSEEAELAVENREEANLSIENSEEANLAVENCEDANLFIENYNEMPLLVEDYKKTSQPIEKYNEKPIEIPVEEENILFHQEQMNMLKSSGTIDDAEKEPEEEQCYIEITQEEPPSPDTEVDQAFEQADEISEAQTTDSEDIIVTPLTQKGPKTNSDKICIEIVSLAFDPEAEVMSDESIQQVYVEYKFHDLPLSETETPVSLRKPRAGEDIHFHFSKVIDLNPVEHRDRRKFLFSMLQEKNPEQRQLKFIVVSDPEEQKNECQEVGYAYLELWQILDTGRDILEQEIDIVNPQDNATSIGKLKVSLQATDALHAIFREMNEDMHL